MAGKETVPKDTEDNKKNSSNASDATQQSSSNKNPSFYSETGGGGAGMVGPAYDSYNRNINDATITVEHSDLQINDNNSTVGEVNPEAVQYNMAVEEDINHFMEALANRAVELRNSPNTFGVQNDLDAINGLQKRAYALKQEFYNPNSNISTEDLKAQLSILQTWAAKHGVDIPATLVVNQGEVDAEIANSTKDTTIE